jgi:hypothetical protein
VWRDDAGVRSEALPLLRSTKEREMKKPRLRKRVLRGLGMMAGVAEAGAPSDFLGTSPNFDHDWKRMSKSASEAAFDVVDACNWIREMQRWHEAKAAKKETKKMTNETKNELKWIPTHRIIHGDCVQLVMLTGSGPAYTYDEAMAFDHADYTRRDDGSWLFHGQPFEGTVEKLEMGRYQVRVIETGHFGQLLLSTDDADEAKQKAEDEAQSQGLDTAIIDTATGTVDCGDRVVALADAFKDSMTGLGGN